MKIKDTSSTHPPGPHACTSYLVVQNAHQTQKQVRIPLPASHRTTPPLPRDPHLQKRAHHLHLGIPPWTLRRLLAINMLQCVSEMTLDHLGGRDPFGPLRRVEVRRGRGGDGVDGRRDELDERHNEFRCNLSVSVSMLVSHLRVTNKVERGRRTAGAPRSK